MDTIAQLEKIVKMYENGLITKEQFELMRNDLMTQISTTENSSNQQEPAPQKAPASTPSTADTQPAAAPVEQPAAPTPGDHCSSAPRPAARSPGLGSGVGVGVAIPNASGAITWVRVRGRG